MMHITPRMKMGAGILIAVIMVISFVPTTAHAQLLGGGCAAIKTAETVAGLTDKAKGLVTGEVKSKIGGAASQVPGLGGLAEQPVFDKSVLAAQTAASSKASARDITRCMLDGLAWTAAHISIQSITRSTVNWINSGFNGSPAFVSDLQSNLGNLADSVANDFFTHLNETATIATGFNLRSPFQDQIAQQLRSEYYRATSYYGLSPYDLQQHTSDPNAFIHGDFSKGGFDAFFSASQNPSNNPIGAYQQANNALWSQIDTAAQQRRAELNWGRGFLPWRGNCTTTSGKGTNPVSLSTTEQCKNNPVRTPGAVIESQLENNLGSGIRQLELADSVNQIVNALMGQLVNQVLGGGGLLGASQPAPGGGQSYVNQATNPSQYNAQSASLSDGVAQNLTNDLGDATQYRDNWQKILDVATAAQQSCGVQSSISAVISDATAGVARGNAAIQQQTVINSDIRSSVTGTNVNQGTQITKAIDKYQSYLGSAIALSADDIDAAVKNSDPTNSTSLYSQMVAAKNSCVHT